MEDIFMVNLKSIMSNFKYVVSTIIGVSLLFLVGCGAVSDTQPLHVHARIYDSDTEIAVTSEQNTELVNTEYTVNTNADNRDYHEWTIEELGNIIVAAGTFWEDWWFWRGILADIRIDPYASIPEHFPSNIYRAVLSHSKFESLNDIRNYLLQFYTKRWIDSVITQEGFPFVEYNGILYIHLARVVELARPRWHTASHVLIEQVGNVAIVETTLYHHFSHRLESGGDAFPFEMTHRFTLIDGRIDIAPYDGMILILPDCIILPDYIEQLRIEERFPHVSHLGEFIILDNGTLVDARLFEAWTAHSDFEQNFNEEDLWFIFDLIIMHIKYMNDGDEYGLLFSTMMGQDASDSNHFHPQIFAFMNEHKNSGLFVERILLSSAGSGIRIVVSNIQGEEFHIWPLINTNTYWEFIKEINAYSSTWAWRINRYFNTLPKGYWISEHGHLLEYIIPFHVFELEPV